MTNPAVIPLCEPDWWQDPYPPLAEVRESHRTAVPDDTTKAFLRFADCETRLTHRIEELRWLPHVMVHRMERLDVTFEARAA